MIALWDLFGCLAFRYTSSGFDCLFAVILINYSNITSKIFDVLFYLYYFEKNQSRNHLRLSYNFIIMSHSILKEKQSVPVWEDC